MGFYFLLVLFAYVLLHLNCLLIVRLFDAIDDDDDDDDDDDYDI